MHTLTNAVGCDSVVTLNLTINTVDVSVTDNPPILKANPTSGNFSVDLGANFDAVVVSLTDLSGKLVYNNAYKHTQQINLELNEPAGTYLLTIEMEGKRAVIRLVKY